MTQFHWNEAGWPQVREQPGLYSELEASLGHPARSCFKNKAKIRKKAKKKKKNDHTTTNPNLAGYRIFAIVFSIAQIPSLGKLKQWLPLS